MLTHLFLWFKKNGITYFGKWRMILIIFIGFNSLQIIFCLKLILDGIEFPLISFFVMIGCVIQFLILLTVMIDGFIQLFSSFKNRPFWKNRLLFDLACLFFSLTPFLFYHYIYKVLELQVFLLFLLSL